MITLLPRCICGSFTIVDRSGLHGIPLLTCPCGVARQDVQKTERELADWYAARYHAGIYSHSATHDTQVAATRLAAYGLRPGAKLLDVGCGNGTFVAEARRQGLDAWGQDLAVQSDGPYVYVGALADLCFPTAEFDVVTVHDVLEHVPDPVAFLHEIKRLLKPNGQLIVDFPRFWDDTGEHHWKPVEHLWMLTEDQLVELLWRVGFTGDRGITIADVCHPIPSKIVVRCYAPQVTRTRILVPAGIGDAYWVMTKLKGFLQEKGITTPPEIVVQDAGGPKRTEPFLKTVPFVYAGGYELLRTRHRIWKEAYLVDGRTVYEKPFPNIDWFIAYNGIMRYGKSLAERDPQWPVDWYFPQHITKEALAFKAACQADGPYCIVYLTDGGMYQEWLKAFTPEQICAALKLLQRQYGLRMIFIGAEWDKQMTGERLAQYGDAGWIDLVGETNYNEMIGAILGASLVVGYPAGNTILATVFKVPTVLLWHTYFDQRFWLNACAPQSPYQALGCEGLTPESVLASAGAVMLPKCLHARQVTPEGRYTHWRCVDCGVEGNVPEPVTV